MPHAKRGRPVDALEKTRRGKKAIKDVQKIRIAALRAKSPILNRLRDIEAKDASRKLDEKQVMFARYWAQGETPRTAAVMAGYSPGSNTNAWRLPRDPAILKLYLIEKKLYEEAAQMTRQKVMDMLKESYATAKLLSEPATMVAAAREIGKMCGYYEPEVKVNINIGGKMADRLNTMTDAQLMKLIEEGGDIIEGESLRVPEPQRLEAPQ